MGAFLKCPTSSDVLHYLLWFLQGEGGEVLGASWAPLLWSISWDPVHGRMAVRLFSSIAASSGLTQVPKYQTTADSLPSWILAGIWTPSPSHLQKYAVTDSSMLMEDQCLIGNCILTEWCILHKGCSRLHMQWAHRNMFHRGNGKVEEKQWTFKADIDGFNS